MKQRHRMRASYIQTLIYYDGPVLALLQNRRGTKVLAYVIRDEIDGFDDPYLAKPTSDKLLDAYLDQKVDLSYVMNSARGGEPFIFDWSKFKDEVLMQPIETITDDVEYLIPHAGIFARNHTEKIQGISVTALISHAYKIDGRWSANDFSRFYAKLADLYSLFSFLDEMKDRSTTFKANLSGKIAKYPWQGGGSYLGFFRDLASESREEYPLQVSKIKYASPGEIEVKGVESSLGHIDSLVRVLDKNKPELSVIYKELRGILERDGVLGADEKDFSVKALEYQAKGLSDKLLAGVGVQDPTLISDACQDHIVTYSKIALAIYRRGDEFQKFHEEGRMRLTS